MFINFVAVFRDSPMCGAGEIYCGFAGVNNFHGGAPVVNGRLALEATLNRGLRASRNPIVKYTPVGNRNNLIKFLYNYV